MLRVLEIGGLVVISEQRQFLVSPIPASIVSQRGGRAFALVSDANANLDVDVRADTGDTVNQVVSLGRPRVILLLAGPRGVQARPVVFRSLTPPDIQQTASAARPVRPGDRGFHRNGHAHPCQ